MEMRKGFITCFPPCFGRSIRSIGPLQGSWFMVVE